jgi:hypothetical protein
MFLLINRDDLFEVIKYTFLNNLNIQGVMVLNGIIVETRQCLVSTQT